MAIYKRPKKNGVSYDVVFTDPSGKQKWKTFSKRCDAEVFESRVKVSKRDGTFYDIFDIRGRLITPDRDKECAKLAKTDKKNKLFIETQTNLYDSKSYVYVIKEIRPSGRGKIKIGTTCNPHHRYLTLTDFPFGVEFLFLFPGDKETEREIHSLFDKFRLNGEWFTCSKIIIDHLESEIYKLHPMKMAQ